MSRIWSLDAPTGNYDGRNRDGRPTHRAACGLQLAPQPRQHNAGATVGEPLLRRSQGPSASAECCPPTPPLSPTPTPTPPSAHTDKPARGALLVTLS